MFSDVLMVVIQGNVFKIFQEKQVGDNIVVNPKFMALAIGIVYRQSLSHFMTYIKLMQQ